MLCRRCQKNQATKCHYEGQEVGYYCYECYDRLFTRASAQNAPAAPSVRSFAHTLAPANVQAKQEKQEKSAGGSVCSVCGRTEKEFLSSGIVGCADCYRELAVVKKAIVKMQGVEEDERHRGKSGTGQEKLAELVFRRNEIKAELEKMIAKKDLKGVNRCREEMQNLNALIYNEEE